MAFPTRNSASGEGLYQPQADINVTPLVDVMLVLLIIFMVTAPLLAAGVKVDLPQAKAAQPLDPKEPVVVTVGKDGKLSLGPDEIAPDRLIEAVQAKLGEDRAAIVHLRGDKDAAYGDVVAIMDRLATNGITHIAIVTGPKSADKAPESAAEAKP
ncbi:MAG: biopolymer transporter ExbD [Roseiarcus sp.]|jgi:biopolymer transport protein ExbD